jgi:hypothetical protein
MWLFKKGNQLPDLKLLFALQVVLNIRELFYKCQECFLWEGKLDSEFHSVSGTLVAYESSKMIWCLASLA